MRNLFVIATVAALSVSGAAYAQSTSGAGDPAMKSEGRATAPDTAPGGAIDTTPRANDTTNGGAGHLGATGRMNGNANGNHMSGSNGQ